MRNPSRSFQAHVAFRLFIGYSQILLKPRFDENGDGMKPGEQVSTTVLKSRRANLPSTQCGPYPPELVCTYDEYLCKQYPSLSSSV